MHRVEIVTNRAPAVGRIERSLPCLSVEFALAKWIRQRSMNQPKSPRSGCISCAVGTLVVVNDAAQPIGIITDRDLVTRVLRGSNRVGHSAPRSDDGSSEDYFGKRHD